MKINRIKVVLIENQRTNKWLAQKLGVMESTVSRWCTNNSQPSLETLVKIAEILKVKPGDLLNK